MGLFVTEDGRFQGWLAALLCCCAAVGEDESHTREKPKISRPTTSRNTVWNQQPTPLKPMLLNTRQAHISPPNKTGINAAFNRHDLVRPISERPPSLKPLDFGESSLVGRMSLHGRRKSSTTLMKRISRPTDFRRLEYTDKQRISLKPLQLEPVVLRENTPVTHGHYIDLSSTPPPECTMEDSNRYSYRATRGTPFERCQQLASGTSSSSPAAIVSERGQVVVMEPVEKPKSKRPALSTQSSSSSMYSLRRQALESSASGTSTPSRPTSSERTRIKRKRSYQKGSRDSTELDVDREILELNTIVEERRAEAARPQSPATQHVPAVAPSMAVRARSETLTDIGSAFSRPLVSLSTPVAPSEAQGPVADQTNPPTSPVKSRLSRPFMSMPDPSVVQVEREEQQQHIRRPSSRITGWLSNLLSSSQATSAFTNPAQEYVSAGRYRTTSQTSLCTTQTDLESSEQTTTASSPISRGHSRSVTADSKIITPISPPSTVDEMIEHDLARRSKTESWPMIPEHPSQVGLAL